MIPDAFHDIYIQISSASTSKTIKIKIEKIYMTLVYVKTHSITKSFFVINYKADNDILNWKYVALDTGNYQYNVIISKTGSNSRQPLVP